MVRRNDFQSPIQQPLPHGSAVGFGFDRRIHLNQCAQSIVIVCAEKQMMWAGFGSDQITGASQEFHFFSRRHMQHVKSMAMSLGQIHRSFCRNDGRFVISNTTVIRHG